MTTELTLPQLDPQEVAREGHQVQTIRAELAELIMRVVPQDDMIEPLKGVVLHRVSSPKEPLHSIYSPIFCVIAQGSKEVFLGDERYVYDPSRYLIVTAELPIVSHVFEASRERPYLNFTLRLDPALVSSVMLEVDELAPAGRSGVRAVNVSPLRANLLDAVVRLVRLLDSPNEAPILAPLIMREIVYRLLIGQQGERLRYVAAQNDNTHRIVQAIERMHKEFARPLQIEGLANELGMSVSSFHHHFKVMTAMSPLQFQKRLRLQEARRLMLGERLDAASAGYRVGYDDASHFSREYKRLFGAPPMRDVVEMRGVVRDSDGV